MSAVLETVFAEQSISAAVPRLNLVSSTIDEAETMHCTIKSAPFAKLFRSKLNVRKKRYATAEDEIASLEELIALIAANGVLQNLIGYEEVVDGVPTGRIGIVAGGRRLASVGICIERGLLPEHYEVPYLLISEEEAIALSLAENSGREAMHPADVFDAMLELSNRGISAEDIGIAYGVDALTVKRRLKLANVSPRLIELYRAETINFEVMQAFAISDDHAAQEMAWESLTGWNRNAHNIRRLLTEQKINASSDRVAKYVGVEAYKAAGGELITDLFSDNETGYISDAALLENLAAKKLEKKAKKVEKDGVAWIEVHVRLDQSGLSEYGRVRTVNRQPTEEEQAALIEIAAELEKVTQEINDGDDDTDYDALYDRESELENTERKIRAALAVPHPGDLAMAGAIVTIDQYGQALVHRNLIRPSDTSKMEKIATPEGDEAKAKDKVKPIHSDRLTRILTGHRTVGLQAELMDRPDVALVVVTHALVRRVFDLRDYNDEDVAKIKLDRPNLPEEAKAGKAAAAFEAKREELLAKLPADANECDLFAWMLEQPQAVILELLAFCASSSIDALKMRDSGPSPFFVAMAKAVNLNMSSWWTATGETYFNHVPKSRVVDVVTQAVSTETAVPILKLKKAQAAEAATRAVAETGWLPEVMRAE